MAERMASTEEEKGVDMSEVKKMVVDEKELEEEQDSLEDLPVLERKGRATVCLGDMKPRCSLANDDSAFQDKNGDS